MSNQCLTDYKKNMQYSTDIEKCKIWLSDFLKEAKLVSEVKVEAKRLGFTKGTLTKARHELNVKLVRSYEVIWDGDIIYKWVLP